LVRKTASFRTPENTDLGLGGLRFYDRMEIKTILDYLRVINQPDNNDALARIINTPSRRIGEATIKSILEEADRRKVTLWSLVLGAVRGRQIAAVKLQKKAEQALSKFVNIILSAQEKLKSLANDVSSIVELIGFILDKTDYEKWLEVHHNDVAKGRWDNVKELITQATDFQGLVTSGNEDEALPGIEGLEQQEDDNPLSRFLSNVALASEVKNDDEEGVATPQVTISTIHAAKGLEWPVVFIPAAYEGSIPHSRADDIDEERRLLYVAMTRSKALLYMSVPLKNSQSEATTLCPFLTSSSLNMLLQKRGPALGPSVVQSIAQILRRGCPTARGIADSSALLKSCEDDLFSENGEDSGEKNSHWSLEMSGSGGSSYGTGQNASKRRRVELGRSNSDMAPVSEQNWKPSYTTTIARASTFTATTMPSKSGFVSAGSHLQILNEQSVNAEVEEKKNIVAKKKPLSKGKLKTLEGQGDLMAFLGKAPPKETLIGAKSISTQNSTTASAQVPPSTSLFSRPRITTTSNSAHCIAPDLASHRLGSSRMENRPRVKAIHAESRPRNDYVFLSSSPPKPPALIIPSSPPQREPVIATNTSLIPLIRPPSFHTTTIAKMQSSTAAKKTLGVKRSMDGWSNRASKGFKPPLRKP
jgi:DNA helicase-2/ATP-dependent DNA helicase PcrA